MRILVVALFAFAFGCNGPTFSNLGNGVGVPPESINAYAVEQDVAQAEARTRLRVDSDAQRIKEHAMKYGISEDEARRQLETARLQLPAINR
jgi:hypothetical protein